MRNQLMYYCGKIVYSTRKLGRKSCDSLSSYMYEQLHAVSPRGVKTQLLHYYFRQFTTQFSPLFSALLSLFEHYFYPVSTAPITYYDRIKMKERY